MKRRIRNSAVSSAVVVVSLVIAALAQQQPPTSPAGQPSKGADAGLAVPKPVPQTIKNPDGSTTTIVRPWDNRTEATTVDKNGALVSTVIKYPTYNGGQITIVETGTTTVTVESDANRTIRHLQKMDSDTRTKKVFDYDEKGQLQKAWVFRTSEEGKEEPQEIYEAANTPSGSPERYNKDTNKFERVKKDDWEDITDRLNATANDIKSIRDQFAPVEKATLTPSPPPEAKDDLAEARAEAAKEPMTMPKERGGLAPPSNPFEKREELQGEAEKQLDPCLVGTWRSEVVEVPVLHEKGGGAGIVITIKEDKSVTVDYNGMTPMIGGNARNVWRGTASGHMWASQGHAGTTDIDTAQAYLVTNGNRNPRGSYADLGPAKISRYTCDETTLIVESVTHRFTYKRQKE
jgi:hypothetical protein